jgi:hypothetical protein
MSKRTRWAAAIGVGVIGLGAAGFLLAREPLAYAEIAVSYGAKQMCSCLFVAGRDSASCLAEFPAEARAQIQFDVRAQTVTAAAAFGAISARARQTPEGGCTLES